jgi:hypothetical protein
MSGLPALSEKDSKTVQELLTVVALDWTDIAVNEACVCNFCGNEVAENDRDNGAWTSGHKHNCVFLRARGLARRLGLLDPHE